MISHHRFIYVGISATLADEIGYLTSLFVKRTRKIIVLDIIKNHSYGKELFGLVKRAYHCQTRIYFF